MVRIYTNGSREQLLKNLVGSLGESLDLIVYEDRPSGGLPIYDVEKAFRAKSSNETTHLLVFPDDMIISDNALSIMNRMISSHPNDIIQLFPYSFEHSNIDISINDLRIPYVYSNALCGNGIIMPVKIIDSCFDWIHSYCGSRFENQLEEKIIWKYALSHDIKIVTTIPSVVQHIGDDYGTTLPYETHGINRKTKWFNEHTDETLDWDSKDTIKMPNFDYRDVGIPFRLADSFLVSNYIIQKDVLF